VNKKYRGTLPTHFPLNATLAKSKIEIKRAPSTTDGRGKYDSLKFLNFLLGNGNDTLK
jgi:hypothetical protein